MSDREEMRTVDTGRAIRNVVATVLAVDSNETRTLTSSVGGLIVDDLRAKAHQLRVSQQEHSNHSH